MPPPRRHLQQARENLAHAQRLLAETPVDATTLRWVVTAAFYCAVHCLQAYLIARGANPRNHVQREAYLADPRYGVPNDVYQAYLALKRRSEGARYLMWRFSAERVQSETLDSDLAKITRLVGL